MLKIEHARAVRYKHSFSIAAINIDGLKKINETAGKKTGDLILKQLGKIINQNIRKIDIIGRYGEDEFVLLMPETQTSDSKILLEKLLEQIRDISIPDVESVTVSCGLAEWNGEAEDTVENIITRTYAALHKAKDKGRDRLVTTQSMASISHK